MELVTESMDLDMLMAEPELHALRHGKALNDHSSSATSESQAAGPGTTPRAEDQVGRQHGAERPAAQREAREAEQSSSWSPDAACDFLLPPPSDGKLRMQRVIGDSDGQRHNRQEETSYVTTDTRGDRTSGYNNNNNNSNNRSGRAPANMMAASPFELDHDMMGMLTTNWTLNGPAATSVRAPPANWGFEPPEAQATALYDASDALMDTPASTQQSRQQQGAASLMMSGDPSADMANIMDLAASEPGFPTNGMANNIHPAQMSQSQQANAAFTGGFGMPYQDCASLPVEDFPLYDEAAGGLYLQSFDGAVAGSTGMSVMGSYTASGPAAASQLAQDASAFLPTNGLAGGAGASQTLLTVDTSFSNAMDNSSKTESTSSASTRRSSMFDEVAAINASFSLPDTALKQETENSSEWNGSSSDFSTVSSSPTSLSTDSTTRRPEDSVTPVTTPGSATSTTSATSATSAKDKDKAKDAAAAPRKPKRIRRLCSRPGCGKRARSQDLCIAHGGGRRCIVEGCEKSSQGGNMCIKHGGGKRCRHPGCDKAAQTNSLCKAHGGGPRCQFRGCTKSSQGGGFCRAHGGGKRCAAEGCNKGTQRGDFCALHGGSRFCEVPGCMRNDRGGGFCAHHGGGKRCSMANCNRSCRRNGLCSTHLRLLGHENGGTSPAQRATGGMANSVTTTASSSAADKAVAASTETKWSL